MRDPGPIDTVRVPNLPKWFLVLAVALPVAVWLALAVIVIVDLNMSSMKPGDVVDFCETHGAVMQGVDARGKWRCHKIYMGHPPKDPCQLVEYQLTPVVRSQSSQSGDYESTLDLSELFG